MTPRKTERDIALSRNYALKAAFVREIEKELRKHRIVFDYQHHAVTRNQSMTVIGNLDDLTVVTGTKH